MTGFIPNWAGNVTSLNVKDFGAKGDGSNDDTTAIQNCIDTAFGPITSPNGASGAAANQGVFFPSGTYNVSAPAQQTITAAAVDSGTGLMKVTVGSTADLQTGYYVYITGASGSDGTGVGSFAYYFNSPHGITVLNGTEFLLTLPNPWPATGTWSSGGVVNTSALHMTAVLGGVIGGAGRDITNIKCTNGPVLIANGWGYGKLENMAFTAAEGTSCVDFNFDGTPSVSSPIGTQSMTIQNCAFTLNGPAITSPTGTERAAFMAGWGSQQLCSEFLSLNNNYGCANGDGYYLGSQNALGHTMIGGAVQSCGVVGVHVGSGCMGAIIGTAFENGPLGAFDIQVDNASQDCMSIIGVRSETKNFGWFTNGIGVHMSGVSHLGAAGGTFIHFTGVTQSPPTADLGCCEVTSSFTSNGTITGTNGYVKLSSTSCGAGLNTLLGSFTASSTGGITACDLCGALTFANLPTANAGIAGMRLTISDGPASPTFGSAASGGSTHFVPVHVDIISGTPTWVYG